MIASELGDETCQCTSVTNKRAAVNTETTRARTFLGFELTLSEDGTKNSGKVPSNAGEPEQRRLGLHSGGSANISETNMWVTSRPYPDIWSSESTVGAQRLPAPLIRAIESGSTC